MIEDILNDQTLSGYMQDARKWATEKYTAKRVTVSGWEVIKSGNSVHLQIKVRCAHFDGQVTKDTFTVVL